MNGEVSVVIPTHYRNNLLRKAISSALDQNVGDVEVIVVDDSGEGHAEPVASSFESVKYVRFEDNRGPQQARTVGIRRSSGEYIQLLDDDDILREGKLRRQIEMLEANPEVGVVYCGVKWEDGSVTLPKPEVRGNVLKYVLGFRAFPCITSTILTRRSLLTDLLPLRDLPGGDDLSLKIRLAMRTEFDYVNEPLVLRRHSDDSRGDELAEGPLEGRRRLLKEHEELYAEHPPDVLGYALASIYRREGKRHLENGRWSPDAIRSFWRMNRAYPGFRLDYVGLLLMSLFGLSGVKFGRWVLHRLEKGNVINPPSH